MSTETLVIICVALAVFALAPILAVRFMRALMVTYAEQIQRTQAQCDESRKAAWAQSEKSVNRLVAVAWPKNYGSYREASGIIEGAQQKIESHYEQPTFEEPEPETPLLDRLQQRNGHDEEPRSRIVASPSDYESGEQP